MEYYWSDFKMNLPRRRRLQDTNIDQLLYLLIYKTGRQVLFLDRDLLNRDVLSHLQRYAEKCVLEKRRGLILLSYSWPLPHPPEIVV